MTARRESFPSRETDIEPAQDRPMNAVAQRSLTVRFVTPAFLGNAEQSGEWRTPPFKALLRQWWRMAVAQDVGFDVNALRSREASLFGSASDGQSQRSALRLRLDQWGAGTLNRCPSRETGSVNLGKNAVSSSLFLGYGPVLKGPSLKCPPAIDAGEARSLRIALGGKMRSEEAALDQALALINLYGTLGGRSRNGWGSLLLDGDLVAPEVPTVSWEVAMQQRDWAHGLGRDQRGLLVWESTQFEHWGAAIECLAGVRAGMRRSVGNALALAFPGTGARMPGWGNNDRLPHSIRFKVRGKDSGAVASVFHVPCRPSDVLWDKLPQSERSRFLENYRQAHSYLDRHPQLHRAQR